MTATSILLADAEAGLCLVSERGTLSLFESGFVAWLRGEPAPPVLAPALSPPLRRYDHVALAWLAESAGWEVDKANLEDGLRWLVEAALERGGAPAPVVSDGLALVVFGLAARERNWLAGWHDRALAADPDGVLPTWLRGGGGAARGVQNAGTVELRLALASRGVAADADADATALLRRLTQGQTTDDTFHAQVLIAALAWIRRAAPIALPGRATPEDVARLLAEVPRALQQWPWENVPRTKNSRAAKWYVDNEYHAQALVWALLAPVFPDLRRENYAPAVGPIQPRVDFGIPSLRLLIEVKFSRTRSALRETVNEIAQDNSNYFATESPYDRLLVFVWDAAACSEDHALVREGICSFDRVVDAIIVSRPGHMLDTPTPTTGEPE